MVAGTLALAHRARRVSLGQRGSVVVLDRMGGRHRRVGRNAVDSSRERHLAASNIRGVDARHVPARTAHAGGDASKSESVAPRRRLGSDRHSRIVVARSDSARSPRILPLSTLDDERSACDCGWYLDDGRRCCRWCGTAAEGRAIWQSHARPPAGQWRLAHAW